MMPPTLSGLLGEMKLHLCKMAFNYNHKSNLGLRVQV